MKRILMMGLMVLMLIFPGCGSSTVDTTFETDDAGNRVMIFREDKTIFPESLPCSVVYNDKNIILENVDFYQSQQDYSYSMFVVFTLDCSELDESQLHWLRESDLDTNVYLTHEKNGYDFDSLLCLGSLLENDIGKISFVYVTSFSKENRYDFAESDITVIVAAEQEELYVEDDHEAKYRNSLHYNVVVPEQISKDLEEIPQPLYDYVAKWLKNLANSLMP